MNKNEKMGWITMSLCLFMMSLPFLIPKIFNVGFIGYDKTFIVSVPVVIIFFISAAKTFPEILISVFGHETQIKDQTSKLPVNVNAQRSRS